MTVKILFQNIQKEMDIMNFKHKIAYIAFGSLFTLTGYFLASLGDTTHAQQNQQVINEIVCKQLKVVNEKGKAVVKIDSDGIDGVLSIYNTEGSPIFNIWDTVGGGYMQVLKNADTAVVKIGVTEQGSGYIQTYKGSWKTH